MIDKRLLKDTVAVSFAEKADIYGDSEFVEIITLKNVRFDRTVTSKGTGNNKERTKAGVIYIYPRFCPVDVTDEWLGAKVTDSDKEYTVAGYQPNFLNGKVFSYEVEVI